ELIGAKTYLSVNVGTGTPQEMNQWVEYITSDSRSALAQERRANGRDKGWKIDYLGIGNETWGCGGNMRPEYYADLYRQYATFVRPPADKPLVKVASGAHAGDLKWTEGLMAGAAGELLEASTLHYYTLPTGEWEKKGSATQFGEAEWIATLKGALKIDEFIVQHSAVMDKYDPKKRVALYVDEWGNWLDTEAGTNGAFLYQQNSLRDAVTAAINLDIFQAHAERVRMANIAQMVNVLQAMILTDGDRMLLTPTYHVFDMYQVFQGATSLPVEIDAPEYEFGGVRVPGVHASAGRDAEGVVHLALVNPDPNKPVAVGVRLAGLQASSIRGRLLTAPAMNTVNSFDRPDAVRPVEFAGATLKGELLNAVLPAKSIVVLSLK
ncbi:MAG: alpha-N-arabinofuranosidase, partial [Pseudoxanthomonas sp.]